MWLSTAFCESVSDGSVVCVSPPACYVFFLPEERRLSLGCSAGSRSGSTAGALPPASGFPCWKEAPLRAETLKTLLASPEDGEVCRRGRAAVGSAAAARQQRGYGWGIAAGGEPREGCAEAGLPLPPPCPGAPFEGLRGVSKVCQSPMGLLKSFLSPTGAPAEISHRVIF